jgi:hypothetical protein
MASLLTFKGRINKDRTLAIRPYLSVKIVNWAEVYYLVGKRRYFLVQPFYNNAGKLTSVYILKCIKVEIP